MEAQKVVVVVVTFNRKDTLVHTIEAIKAQTYRASQIVIVDNASTDGTSALINAAGYAADPSIDYVLLSKNIGGAGGFHEGMKRALAHGADWIWVMDDDVAAAEDCLAQLLKWSHVSECLMPLRRNLDGSDNYWEHFVDIYSGWRVPLHNISFSHGKAISFTNAACFEGMLVSRRVLEQTGLPDTKYFIGEDDTLFGVIASTYTNNAYVRDAIMHRQLPTVHTVSPWKTYYIMRNGFYLFTDVQSLLGFSKHRFDRAKFILLRTVDLLRSLKKGPVFFWRSLIGFKDGYIYMSRNWREASVK